MAENIDVENTERAVIRIAENEKFHFWKNLTVRKSQMVTLHVTQTELENHLKQYTSIKIYLLGHWPQLKWRVMIIPTY